MVLKDLWTDMHSINALGLEPAVAKDGDRRKMKPMPSQLLPDSSTLKEDFKSSLNDINKAMNKNKKKVEEDTMGGSASPVSSSTAATSQPFSAILDAFLNATKGATLSTATILWADATGPSYKQVHGKPTLSASPAGSTTTGAAAAAATGGARCQPHARREQSNGQGLAQCGAPAQEQSDRSATNRNRQSQRESQGHGTAGQSWRQGQQQPQQNQQFQQPQPQPGGMGGTMMAPMNMMQPGAMGMMQPGGIGQGFDQSQMQMFLNAQVMQMGYPARQDGGKGGGDNGKGGRGGVGAGTGQSNDQQARMMQLGAPGSFVLPNGQTVMMPMMMQAPQQGMPQGAMMGMRQQPGQQ